MRFEKTFLRSKVAQRIAFLFILCALIPIALLSILSFSQVTKHLHEQSQNRLHQTSKSLAMAIFERLLFLEAEMIRMASSIPQNMQSFNASLTPEFDQYHKDMFKSIFVYKETGEYITVFGDNNLFPEFTQEEKQLILTGNVSLITKLQGDHSPHIFLSRAITPNSSEKNTLLAEVESLYLWFMGYENPLPPMTELFILDHNKNVLFSTLQSSLMLSEQISKVVMDSSSGQFESVYDGEDYLYCYREIFLHSRFQAQPWIVVTSESKTYINTPVATFKKTFPLVILLSLWVVIFLSFSQIRRSLIPLEKLKEGAQHIANREFETKVTVHTHDEFADVASAFNTMAFQLGRQFKTLTTIAEIDRAILSAFNTDKIVNTLLNRMCDVFPCQGVSVTLLHPNKPPTGRTYVGGNSFVIQKIVETIELSPEETQELYDNPDNLFIETNNHSPSYLSPLAQDGINSFSVFPIFLKEKLAGMISLGYTKRPEFTKEDLAHARQLSDQVGVALSNARLIKELSDFNWGTLTALARTIDAKSPWTAGHSERVTKFALEIGEEMGFSEKEMDILHRGGLLHDIGKLGIPNEILDKSGKLTQKEKKTVQKHARLGARILEPIAPYTDIMLIVLQHHENYDGTGYPDGLAGEEISLFSRIFALADRFEAITTDRPYRKAFSFHQAIDFIAHMAGTEFDPKVIEAFLRAQEKTGNLSPRKCVRLSFEVATRSPK